MCFEVKELRVPPDAKQRPWEMDPGAAQWEGAGAADIRGQDPEPVGEEGPQEPELHVHGVGPVSG